MKRKPTRKCETCGKLSWVIIVSAAGKDLCGRCTDEETLLRDVKRGKAEMGCSGTVCDNCIGLHECYNYHLLQHFTRGRPGNG
jgi:hypothetical protein